MTQETAVKVKYASWGVVGGAIIAMILGFAWGGWVTEKTANEMTAEAVLASNTAICVSQFNMAEEYEAKLKEFGDTESWKRHEYISQGGWDKMPGQDRANSRVARACAESIDLLAKQ